jgi:pantoate--beta-alanine ligase
MKIILNNHDLSKTLGPFNDIGFVPTMGGIHEGHISLIKRSIKSNKKTIVSIFVNPKQFNNSKDFNLYPSNIKKDLAILKKIRKLDFVYIPRFKDVYENKSKSKVKIEKKI